MKTEKVTIGELSARTGISEDSIKEMRNPKHGQKRFFLKNILAVIIGLHLCLPDGLQMIEASGYCLRNDDEVDRIYLDLISNYSGYSVAACNDYLVELGLLPLTDNNEITSYTESFWE